MSSKLERFGITDGDWKIYPTMIKPSRFGTINGAFYEGSGYTENDSNLIAQAPAMLEVLIEDTQRHLDYIRMLMNTINPIWQENLETLRKYEKSLRSITVLEKALGRPWAEIKEIWESEK
jgi:hypothetical protein